MHIGPPSFAPSLLWWFLELLAAQPAKATSIGPHGGKLPRSIIYQLTNASQFHGHLLRVAHWNQTMPIKDHIQFPISVVNQFHRCFPIRSSKIPKLENDLRKRNNKIVWIWAYFGAPPLSQFHCWGPNKDHLVLEPQHVSQAPLWRSEAVGSIEMHLVALRFVHHFYLWNYSSTSLIWLWLSTNWI